VNQGFGRSAIGLMGPNKPYKQRVFRRAYRSANSCKAMQLCSGFLCTTSRTFSLIDCYAECKQFYVRLQQTKPKMLCITYSGSGYQLNHPLCIIVNCHMCSFTWACAPWFPSRPSNMQTGMVDLWYNSSHISRSLTASCFPSLPGTKFVMTLD
jgi:hypothetical protein